MKASDRHSFVVPAYGESPYLSDCILSLSEQTVKSRIVLATSTPSVFLERLADRRDIPIFVNETKAGIASDWNFAWHIADTPLFTIAHQDDRYDPFYTESILEAFEKRRESLIVFTDYCEQYGKKVICRNRLLNVKRLLLLPFYGWKGHVSSPFWKTGALSLGNPICCPSITYNKEFIGAFAFDPAFSMNLDWDALWRLARQKGAFVHLPEKFLIRRIHGDSESARSLKNRRRQVEDRMMFEKFWPGWLVRALEKIYAAGYCRLDF